MYANLEQTLGSMKSRAVFQRRDISATPMADFIKQMNKSNIKGMVNIEEAAIAFYLSNHGFHLVESKYELNELLSPRHNELVNLHINLTTEMGLRMFYYLMVISVEEAQFGTAKNSGLYTFIANSTSEDASKWVKKVLDRKINRGLFGDPKDVGQATLGECIKSLELVFRFASWTGGFGGLPWAQIAETAGEVVRGTNSLELMVDKSFTLCHNNGAIFNKGHYFSYYNSDFYNILDIQASGQIPAAIFSKNKTTGMQSKKVLDIFNQYAMEFPAEFQTNYNPNIVKDMANVRRKKEEVAAAAATSFLSSGGGWGASQPVIEGPPKRNCDDLFTLDDFASVYGAKSGFGL